MAAQNCDILLAALKAAQAAQAKAGSDLAAAKTAQTAAKQKAANAQSRIAKAQAAMAKEQQQLANDNTAINAATGQSQDSTGSGNLPGNGGSSSPGTINQQGLNAGKPLHPTSAADQAAFAQAIQQYRDDLIRQQNDINQDLTNIQNAKADMDAADAANSLVDTLQNQYETAQGKTNAAQAAYDACVKSQTPLVPPSSGASFTSQITTTSGTVSAPDPPPLTATFTPGDIVSPSDFETPAAAIGAGFLAPPPTQITSPSDSGGTVSTTVPTPAPSAQAPQFTSSFYNPSLGIFAGQTNQSTVPTAGTTTFGLPGNPGIHSTFNGTFPGSAIISSGVTPDEGTFTATVGTFDNGGGGIAGGAGAIGGTIGGSIGGGIGGGLGNLGGGGDGGGVVSGGDE